MKKIISCILLMTMMIMMPYSVMAQTTDVGVKITGSASIEVITTISADITLDLSTGETTPTYMWMINNSTVPVEAKITNISTSSPGAPSTFIDAMHESYWANLSQEDTAKYVNFNITGEGKNVKNEVKDILPGTEVSLGTLAYRPHGYNVCSDSEYRACGSTLDSAIFEINANFGKNWSAGEKNFTYQITTVYSQATEFVSEYHELGRVGESTARLFANEEIFILDDTTDFFELEFNDPAKDYLVLGISFVSFIAGSHSDDFETLSGDLSVKVNGIPAVYKDNRIYGIGGIGDDDQVTAHETSVKFIYEINALSKESSPYFLTVEICYGDNTYTRFLEVLPND